MQASKNRPRMAANKMANPEHERAMRDAQRSGNLSMDMTGFDLSGLRLSSAHLEGVNLAGADLSGANLSGGYFRGSNLRNARLNKASLAYGDFRNADLSGADMTGSDLTGAILSGAILAMTKMTRAKLVKSRVDGADFTGADVDRADLRGVKDLSEEQLASTINSGRAILDERMLTALNRSGDLAMARHGKRPRKSAAKNYVDLAFDIIKPSFGDVFLLCGFDHPLFPSTGNFGFGELADLGVEQVDDYFAICEDGDPFIWIFPLMRGNVIEHHPGPYDGLRIELAKSSQKKLWTECVRRFKEALRITAT